MTKEDKELLLKDLCARLPYGVKILHKGWNYEWDDELSTVERVVGIDEDFIYTKVIDTHNGEEYRDDEWPIDTFDDKLLLRPMLSMTEEERKEYELLANRCIVNSVGFVYFEARELIRWFLRNHFDYNGLIDMGLAIEVNDENDPYKD